MLTLYKYEGKTEEEAVNNCLEDLNVAKENLYFSTTEEAAKLFKSKKYIVEALKKEDVIHYVRTILKNLLLNLLLI